jgi:hypothetical protein
MDPRQVEIELGESLEMAASSVGTCKSACEEMVLHVIITVMNSVARIRLVKTKP